MKRSHVYLLSGLFAVVVLLLFALPRNSSEIQRSSLTAGGNDAPGAGSAKKSGSAALGGPNKSLSQTQAAGNSNPNTNSTNNLAPANSLVSTNPPRKRAWDPEFLSSLHDATKGTPIRFELVDGRWAAGMIEYSERRNGELIYVSGKLSEPEAGRFFFQKQTSPGKAGDFVGVVEFPASQTAYRIEPTGPNDAPELVERPLNQVICVNLPPPDPANTNDVEEVPPLYPNDFPSVSIPDYQHGIIRLESLQGVPQVIYLDFQAGYTPTWGGITYASFNFSNNKIADIWRRVAEDYMPFNINVTTDLKVYQAAPEISRQRVIFTPTKTAAPSAGGVAYFHSWNWSGDTPCWVFNSGTKGAAEAASHEVGHTLNLSHDGKTDGTTYYTGQGSGATGWAPIMGTGYTRNVVQFSKGEYADANNSQNDLNIITTQNNGVAYRTDDTGNTLVSSRYLEIYPGNTASAEGVIERTADTDAFQFTTTGGLVSLQANPTRGNDWANLAVMATLADASDAIITSNNPQTVLSASITTNLPAGTYTFRVTGTGRNDPLTDGFSDYASLGYYSITGSVAGARLPSRFSLPENTANSTLVGVVLANNPGGNPLVYAIASGNTGNTFAIDNAGYLTVVNNALLNYETFAANTQLTVQFELFVNITNTVDSAQTELNRRVVIAIRDVNEPPSVTGFSATLLEHSLPGAYVGSVTSSDPDYFTRVGHSITGGNTGGMFAIDHDSGAITVVGDLNAAIQSLYNLTVTASDEDATSPLTANTTVTITVLPNTSPFQPGAIPYAVYTGIGGNTISSLTNAAKFPTDPAFEKLMVLFEGDQNWSDNYGAVMRGYLIPPTNGDYRFWIASDDNSELWLSTTTNPATKTLIASVSGSGSATNPRQWNKYASQRSALQSLVAGQAYYIEARMKEGSVSDNVAVAWTGPSAPWEADVGTNVIPGQFLAPYFMNYVPHLTSTPYNLRRDAGTGALFDIIGVTDVNINDTHTFAIVGGNTGGLFAIDPVTGTLEVTDGNLLQTTTHTNYALQVRVTDNGVPPLSNTNTVMVNIIETNPVITTTVFLDNGFEDDTAGSYPNSPTIGSWDWPSQTTSGARVGNDPAVGAFEGNNYLRIWRGGGAENTARLDANFPTIPLGDTVIVSFALLYESTGDSEASIQLYSGSARRVVVYASPDLVGSPYFTPTNFYTYNGDITVQVNSSLPVTPGAWQTIEIEYTSGSTNLTLTVNGVSQTLLGAVTPGTVDHVRFNTGNINSIYYLDGQIKVETATEVVTGPAILFQDDFQSDAATTTFGGGDYDPVIGAGDIGGTWTINEYGSSYLQVLSDTAPGSNIAGTNNYVSIYRDSSITRNGGAYGTGWDSNLTLNRVVQFDFKVWQPTGSGSDITIEMLSQSPPSGPGNADANNISPWIDLTLNDSTWHAVHVLANYHASITQLGIPPQTYTISIDGGLPTTNAFWTQHNSVQTIGFLGGANYTTVYFDDVKLQVVYFIPKPLTVSIATMPDKNQQLTFTGNQGSNYVVQAATDLTNWISISTNTADGVTGQFIYKDLTATNFIQRFYRGRSQ